MSRTRLSHIAVLTVPLFLRTEYIGTAAAALNPSPPRPQPQSGCHWRHGPTSVRQSRSRVWQQRWARPAPANIPPQLLHQAVKYFPHYQNIFRLSRASKCCLFISTVGIFLCAVYFLGQLLKFCFKSRSVHDREGRGTTYPPQLHIDLTAPLHTVV